MYRRLRALVIALAVSALLLLAIHGVALAGDVEWPL